jgi:hypothetical protein
VRAALPDSFASVLDLRFSPTMVDPDHEGWSPRTIESFARELISGSGGGLLSRVWDYYGPGSDLAPGRPLRFEMNGRWYSRIRVDVYFQTDCCRNRCDGGGCPAAWPDSCRRGDWVECGGFGAYRQGNWIMVAGGACPDTEPRSPEEVAGSALAHEMAHLCHRLRDPFADSAFSEMLATGAEYLMGERWHTPAPNPRSTEYDVSLKSGSEDNLRCAGREVTCKYNQFRLWNAYLFSHFSGAADSLGLVYRWVHHASGSSDGGAPHIRSGPSWRGLAEVLLEEPFASQIPGRSAGEKLGNLYQRFAMARYMDLPEGEFGFGADVSPRPMRFFEWPDTLALPRRRAVPPLVRLGRGERRAFTAWRDPVQPWAGEEPCRILTTGSDYWVVKAAGADQGDLQVRIRGRAPIPPNQSFRLGYATYAESDAFLCGKTPLKVVENVVDPAAAGDSLEVSFAVPDFGRRANGALIVFSMVEKEPSEGFAGVQSFDYEIEFSTGK